MKKNIGFIPMDFVLEEWLLEKLIKEPPKSDCAEDLLSGIRDMLSGEVTALLLSASGEAEASSLDPLDGMRIGELEISPKSRRVVMGGAEVSLTPKEFDILYFLAQNRGRYLPRNRSTGQCGLRITFWMTATSWHLSENYGRKLSLTQTRPSTF